MAILHPVVVVLVLEPLLDAMVSQAARRRRRLVDACFPMYHEHLARILSEES